MMKSFRLSLAGTALLGGLAFLGLGCSGDDSGTGPAIDAPPDMTAKPDMSQMPGYNDMQEKMKTKGQTP